MGMISEGAVENTVLAFVTKIKTELGQNKDKPDACVVLKRLGLFALELIDGGLPNWYYEYKNLFSI